MPVPRALLDTDTLSAVMRGTPAVLTKAREYLAEHGVFSFSIITRYEVTYRLANGRVLNHPDSSQGRRRAPRS
jgi:predicted nucleic acid-binding protein